ncbi:MULTISPECIES: hypothetical protein [Photorhabdus]|uniref:Nicotianamine synthase n=2 Tax=Photorhabdus TaxID=29487 RepID=A0ABX0B473_9GAMM|nr:MULTISPECIES: hypothetical protein [Photorhabdus]MCC8376093.1 hypothetical protein [Photorhabdus bodei]MCC8466786.1 hypothetical protein [Photorhabdus bodei]MCT8354264.1 hypothetical protein [Photorhabdus kayaii]MDB6370258.1 hypothetical protein [Photorhabdus bodei]MDB6375030.1 hypothetical protein [Photorhabdus bodei]
MFDDIINKINEAINYPIEKYSLSPKFNELTTKIRDDLLDVKKYDPSQYNRFCEIQSQLLSVLDNKALAYSKNWEMMIADYMTGTLPFSGDEASAVDKMKNYYIERNRSLYFDEKDLLKNVLSHPKYVCHVGCGPMPSSVLMWLKYTDAHITAIDHDKYSVESARAVFETWRRPKQISADRATFVATKGENFNYAGMDLIIISRAILNKEGVFSAILNSDKDTVSIIERTPRYFYSLEFYRPKGFERYQLATKERYDTNLNLYKFSSWSGEG